MCNISFEDLQRYRGLMMDIKAIEAEINYLYKNIHSPSFDKVDAGRVSARFPKDKTFQTIMLIEQRKEQLNSIYEKNKDFILSIYLFVDQIEDDELRGIVRMHFLAGKTWRETSKMFYGVDEEANARIYFRRNKHKIFNIP